MSFPKRRQERRDLEDLVVQNNRDDSQRDRYDQEYTNVAYAAPGYGSSLLPADISHGGHVQRNSRTS